MKFENDTYYSHLRSDLGVDRKTVISLASNLYLAPTLDFELEIFWRTISTTDQNPVEGCIVQPRYGSRNELPNHQTSWRCGLSDNNIDQ